MGSLKKEQLELTIWEGTNKQEAELGHLDQASGHAARLICACPRGRGGFYTNLALA